MQAVIGGYRSSHEAERAVRRLELRQFSIQDVIVADQGQRAWRKLSRWYDGRKSQRAAGTQFLVVMTGSAQDVQRAGELLSREAAA